MRDGVADWSKPDWWLSASGELVSGPRKLISIQFAVNADAPAFIVEGEKTADAAGVLFDDYVVVTSPSGSRQLSMPIGPRSSTDVTIWPDHDASGASYELDVIEKVPLLDKRSAAGGSRIINMHFL